jgi:nicotinamide riboside transporter PnuC
MGWWSWLLTIIGVTGLWLAGQKNVWGWAVGLAAQPVWIIYALATGQYGFVVSGLAYGGVYAKNFIWWWRERSAQATG